MDCAKCKKTSERFDLLLRILRPIHTMNPRPRIAHVLRIELRRRQLLEKVARKTNGGENTGGVRSVAKNKWR